MSFQTLGLSDKVLSAIHELGYNTPTPIQAEAIPHVLSGRDILGIAQTGTGKTAAFTLPLLCRLEGGRARARMPRTLILEPTRELAAQVEEAFVRYGVNHKLTVGLLIGGVAMADQERKLLRGVDIVIATPGRLLDFAERGKLMLNCVEFLVVDEADRMLDMGFITDIERIFKMVPPQRQTLFFSATMSNEIVRLTKTFLHDPVRIEVARRDTTAKTIAQFSIPVSDDHKLKREALRHLIHTAIDLKNLIVFCNRKRDVSVVYRSLVKHGFAAGALHGDLSQSARMQALEDFRGEKLTILVCSDVAARGLDIPDVSHVINYDVPRHPEDYVHRIGRTGRAGRSGVSVTMVSNHDEKAMRAVIALIGQVVETLPAAPQTSVEQQEATTQSDDRALPDKRPARARRRTKNADRQKAPGTADFGEHNGVSDEAAHNLPKDVRASMADVSYDDARADAPVKKRRRGRRGGQGRGNKRGVQTSLHTNTPGKFAQDMVSETKTSATDNAHVVTSRQLESNRIGGVDRRRNQTQTENASEQIATAASSPRTRRHRADVTQSSAYDATVVGFGDALPGFLSKPRRRADEN